MKVPYRRKPLLIICTLAFALILFTAASAVTITGVAVVGPKITQDLVVTSITAPTTGVKGKTVTVSNTIKNQGNTATKGFWVNYYLRPAQLVQAYT